MNALVRDNHVIRDILRCPPHTNLQMCGRTRLRETSFILASCLLIGLFCEYFLQKHQQNQQNQAAANQNAAVHQAANQNAAAHQAANQNAALLQAANRNAAVHPSNSAPNLQGALSSGSQPNVLSTGNIVLRQTTPMPQQRFQGLVNNRPAIVISQPRTQIPQQQQQLMQQIRLQQQQAARLRPPSAAQVIMPMSSAVTTTMSSANPHQMIVIQNQIRQPGPNAAMTRAVFGQLKAAAAGSRWDAGHRQQLSGSVVAVARIQQSRFSSTYLKFFRLVQPIICDQSAGSARPPGVDHNEQFVVGSVWQQPSGQLGPTHVVANELHAGPRLRRPLPVAQRRRIHARHSPGPTLSIRRPTIVVGSREIIQFINSSVPSLQFMLRNRCLANVGSVTSEPFFLFCKFPQRLCTGCVENCKKILELCAKLSRPAESNEFVLRRQFPTYSSDSYGFLIFFFPSGDLVFVPHL